MSTTDFLWFVDKALDEMEGILQGLGDELANRRPALDGANSAVATVTHCLGVMEFWGGYAVAGRSIERDRNAEFRASGPVADLIQRVRGSRRQLEADLSVLDGLAPPLGTLEDEDAGTPLRTQAGVLLHILEELTQHLGQMELSRDVLLADS